MRKRALMLQEKVFFVKTFYSEKNIYAVCDLFEKRFSLKTTTKIIPIVEKLVAAFERTGSVTHNVIVDGDTVVCKKERDDPGVENPAAVVAAETGRRRRQIKQIEVTFEDEDHVDIIPVQVDHEEVVQVEQKHVVGDAKMNQFVEPVLETVVHRKRSTVKVEPKSPAIKKKAAPPPAPKPQPYSDCSDGEEDADYNPDGQFKCPRCPRRFETLLDKNKHVKSHLVPKTTTKYYCEMCDRPFAMMKERDYHQYSHLGVHERGDYPCDHCPSVFPTAEILKDHLWLAGRRKRTYERSRESVVCETCGKLFHSSQTLASHRKIHTGEDRDFMCRHCGKTFLTKSGMEVHSRIHTGERPFRCLICGKGFMDSSTLRVHQRQHTGEAPYICHICGKTTKQAQNLRSHLTHMHKMVKPNLGPENYLNKKK